MTSTTPPPSRYPGLVLSTSSPVPYPSPASSASSSRGGAGTKRKQVKNACVNCQRACKKCDDQRPCSRCVKYGIEDGCINSQRKERKRKTESERDANETSSPPPLSSSTRVQLNLSSRRLRAEAATESQEPLALRFSSRNSIRPFPKELLESLQDEHEQNTGNESAPFETAQVTEEFKTLARICSDIHTVMSQPVVPTPSYSVHPAMAGFMRPSSPPPPAFLYQRAYGMNSGIQRASPPQMPQFHPHINHHHHQYQYQHQHHSHLQQQLYPMLPASSICPPAAPSELLLKPSSPIYNTIQHQHQQQQLGIPRNFMNRTPPEDTAIDPSDGFDKDALS